MLIFWGFLIIAGIAAVCGFFLRKKQWKNWLYGLAVIVHAGGALLAVSQEDELTNRLQEQQWPSIRGTVDTSFIGGTRAFHPLIRYSYRIGTKRYTRETNLETPGFGGRKSRQQTARNIIRVYTPGKKIIVYYNPREPEQSTLVRNIPWHIFIKIGLGYLLFGLGLCLLFSKTFSFIPNR